MRKPGKRQIGNGRGATLSTIEVERLITAFKNGRLAKEREVSEAEIEQLIRWAETTRVNDAFLLLILRGEADVLEVDNDGGVAVLLIDGESGARVPTESLKHVVKEL